MYYVDFVQKKKQKYNSGRNYRFFNDDWLVMEIKKKYFL